MCVCVCVCVCVQLFMNSWIKDFLKQFLSLIRKSLAFIIILIIYKRLIPPKYVNYKRNVLIISEIIL